MTEPRKADSLNNREKASSTPPSRQRTAWTRIRKSRRALSGFLLLFLLSFVAIFSPYIAPYSPVDVDILNMFAPPSTEHFLGTDETGRDVLSRLIYGTRTSLLVGTWPCR